MQWYYAENNQSIGPLSEEQFEGAVQAGNVAGETLVWHEGMDDWVSYQSLTSAPAEPAAAAPAEAATELSTCCECGREFRPEDMVEYENYHVCAECKPTFFQRLQEGVPPIQAGGDGSTPNADITARARSLLSGNWALAIGVCLVFWVMSMAIGLASSVVNAIVPLSANIMQLVVIPPLTLGFVMFFVAFTNDGEAEFGMLFRGFKRYGTSIGAYFFRNLIVSLGALAAMSPGIVCIVVGSIRKIVWLIAAGAVLVIPGVVLAIVLSYMLAMTFYIVADDDTVGYADALRRSRVMMKGVKWKYLCLSFRFLGWSLLCMFLTLGIGFIWLAPYMATSLALFYHDVKGRIWIVQ